MYDKIREIEKILDEAPLENLALLFSRKSGDKYLRFFGDCAPKKWPLRGS